MMVRDIVGMKVLLVGLNVKNEMADLKEILLQGISKKLDKLIELVRELIRTLGNKINKE